jgi:hypothetical protein
LPTLLSGSQSSKGSYGGNFGSGIPAAGVGGNSGAGLLLMAREIYVTSGYIDLSGDNGVAGQTPASPYNWGYAGGGGGGGGGSFVALAERDVNGLINMSILTTRIDVSGGAPGAIGARWGGGCSLELEWPAIAGGTGCIISQIIG